MLSTPPVRCPPILRGPRSRVPRSWSKCSADPGKEGLPERERVAGLPPSWDEPQRPSVLLDNASTSESKDLPWFPIFALGGAGALETGYLTLSKIFGTDIACPLNGGCSDVLNSSYASLFGSIPLPLLGCVSYTAVAALAIVSKTDQDQNNLPSSFARWGLLGGSIILASTSSELLYVLATEFREPCTWCILSALLSFSIAGLTLSSLSAREAKQGALPGTAVASAVITFLLIGQSGNSASAAAGQTLTQLPYEAPVVDTESTVQSRELAKALRLKGARMYGAFWCPHCLEEKELFGRQAMKDFPYVECFPDGWKKGRPPAKACVDAGVKGFPTWIFPGKEPVLGTKSLEELRDILVDMD